MARISYKAVASALRAAEISPDQATFCHVEDIYLALREKAGNPAERPFTSNLAGGYPPYTATVERFLDRYHGFE